ncbi:MAG: DDE-type integrase/transposase/recombinase [Clostridiales bacterium]|nr:DDE-type integrase/transposase/recombinase [Clostridiales bacterium]
MDVALSRYKAIAALLANSNGYATMDAYFEMVAKSDISMPNGNRRYSASTIKGWYYLYLKNGLKGLMPSAGRSDRGTSKVLSPEAQAELRRLRQEHTRISATNLFEMLKVTNFVEDTPSYLVAVIRFVRSNNLQRAPHVAKERKMFQKKFSNELWQTDTKHGPLVKVNGEFVKTYIIIIEDDKSRKIVGSGVFFEDNALNMQLVFKDAINTSGVPQGLYADNGGPYKNKQLTLICATLGTGLLHTPVKDPQAKGKIERLNRTVDQMWLDREKYETMAELKDGLDRFVSMYNNRTHGTTKISPQNSWTADYDLIRFADSKRVDEAFMHRDFRIVNNASAIKIWNQYFSAPPGMVQHKIEVRWVPDKDGHSKELFVYSQGKRVGECKPVDMEANAYVPYSGKKSKSKGIDYSDTCKE